MQRMEWHLGSILMAAILLLPLVVRAATNLQQDRNQVYQLAADDDKRDRNEKRYYDRDRKETIPGITAKTRLIDGGRRRRSTGVIVPLTSSTPRIRGHTGTGVTSIQMRIGIGASHSYKTRPRTRIAERRNVLQRLSSSNRPWDRTVDNWWQWPDRPSPPGDDGSPDKAAGRIYLIKLVLREIQLVVQHV